MVLEFVQQHAPEPGTAQARACLLLLPWLWLFWTASMLLTLPLLLPLTCIPPSCCLEQIAGNSVHVDLAFLRKGMPKLVDHLHYRWVGGLGKRGVRWVPLACWPPPAANPLCPPFIFCVAGSWTCPQ